MRTREAAIRYQRADEQMKEAIFEGSSPTEWDFDTSERTMMLLSMQQYPELRPSIQDLRIAIIENQASADFITSDDPSAFTNKFCQQRVRQRNFGLLSSGSLLFLPLTTKLALMCYDGGTYTVPDKRGYLLPIRKDSDIEAINELQYLKAADSIYFADWNSRDAVKASFAAVSPRRPESRSEISVLVRDHVTDDGEHYREATAEERRTGQHTIVGMSFVHPAPTRWISKLKYRNPVQTYSNGSVAGYVRKSARLEHRDDPGWHRVRTIRRETSPVPVLPPGTLVK